MGIIVSVLIGAATGGLALVLGKSSRASEWSTLAVGILGALLGTVWLSFSGRFGLPILSCLGAAVALVLWTVTQKMLVASSVERD